MSQRYEKWTEIYEQLSMADRKDALGSEELEKLALAAYLTGRDAESYQLLERAHQNYLDEDHIEDAIRCVFWLGLMLMNAGEKARGSGWFARGERLVLDKENQDFAEKGLLLIPEGLGALYSGYPARAQKFFEQAETIGEEFGNADLIVLGRLGHGQAMIQQGDVSKGIKLLDETMITVETEEVFPLINGIVYCAVIESCRKVWDISRAQEWTSALTRWCEAQPDIVPFRGECLVRRAEMIQLHGEWEKAFEETRNACDLLARRSGESITGEAYYRKAELHRLAGEFESAEDNYREAAKWGRNPQPGLALLRLAQGQDDAAETSIRNTLRGISDTIKRADILPAAVKILIAVKKTEEALEAVEELNTISIQFDAPYLQATYAHCRGAVFLADGKFNPALEYLQKALKLWNSMHLPYESACTRELKGIIYKKLNDKDSSDTELSAAKWIFEQLNAKHDLERINRMLNRKRDHEPYGLSLRELQVLNLIAAGKTNKSVASELFISVRTVDRHVSNIFNKLGVSSRVEAISISLKKNILDNTQ
ncbi:MAG: LuxR C-terminal-related transcriptional regulator [Bacteroidales bacterium]